MDHTGNIGLGYSASSSSLHPAIRYTGRTTNDPINTMEAEASIIEGSGSQTPNLSRWGDYTAMRIDPADDCTFWYTNEYLQSNGTFNWSTAFGSFKFGTCGTTPDFSMSANPSSLTIGQGNQNTSQITVTSLNGFNSSVGLTVSGCPTSAACSISSPVTPTGTATLSVSTTSTTATGAYTLTVTGKSGTLTHSTSVSLTVNAPPDFSMSSNPSSLTITQGSQSTSKISITASNGFNSTVNLSVGGCPAGATCSVSPTSITPAQTSTLTVSPTSSTTPGPYTITITGASGSLSHSTTVGVTVNAPAPDFSLSQPSALTITQGNQGTSQITVTSLNGFNSSVSVAVTAGCPSNATCSFSPTSVVPTAASTLMVTTALSTPTGTYTLTISGSSGTLTHTTTTTLTVTAAAPDFGISATPTSLTVSRGSSGSVTVNLSEIGAASSSVTLSVSGLPARTNASFSANPVSTPGSSVLTISANKKATPGTVTLTISGTNGSYTHSTPVMLIIQ